MVKSQAIPKRFHEVVRQVLEELSRTATDDLPVVRPGDNGLAVGETIASFGDS